MGNNHFTFVLVRIGPIRKISRQTDHIEAEDQPLGGVEVIPLRAVPVIAGIGVVIVVITLAESDQGDQPAVPAAVLSAVRLVSPHMADRIDAEGRIQHQEGSEHTGEKKPGERPNPTAMKKTDQRRNGKT